MALIENRLLTVFLVGVVGFPDNFLPKCLETQYLRVP